MDRIGKRLAWVGAILLIAGGTTAARGQECVELTGRSLGMYLASDPAAEVEEVALESPAPQTPQQLLASECSLDLELKAPYTLAGGGEEPPPPAGDGPPLPLHNVEGVGGCLLVPNAYLVNPGPPGTVIGKPSPSYKFIKAGTKTVNHFAITETLCRRFELGYSFGVLGLGNFPRAVQRVTGIDIGLDHVMVHTFNLRGMIIEETEHIPAVTAGVSFKYNPNVQTIDRRLRGGVRALGFERSNGTDFYLTATKSFPKLAFGRPVILTGGIRFSQAAQLGYLGFDDAYRLTGEGSAIVLLTDRLALAYEFRQKKNPYHRLGKLVGKEEPWQSICLAFIVNDHLAVAAGWADFGNLANGVEDCVWGIHVKYEF